MTVTPDTLRLMEVARVALDTRLRFQTTRLTGLWVVAWNEVSNGLDSALLELLTGAESDLVSRAAMLRSSRMLNALRVIGAQLDSLTTQAGTTITADLTSIVNEAGQAQAAIIGSQLPPGSMIHWGGWDRVSGIAIQSIVDRMAGRVVSDLKPLSPQAYAALRAELIRGVAVGANPRVTAQRIVKRAEYRFNGGLARALTVSRTETLDAHRAAAALTQQQSADVLTGWKWLAALDARTCPACISQNGTVHPLSEPGPLGHQNCRCARIPVTPSWADLGFEGIDEPEDVFPDAPAWFDNLTVDEQRRILGPDRYEAWKAGDFPMDQWAVRRSNKGWRDAYYVAPVQPRSSASAAA